MSVNRFRIVAVTCVSSLLATLVLAQPMQPDPRKEAKDLLKPYRDKIKRDNKSAKEVLESLKVIEALAEEMNEEMARTVEGVLSYRDLAVRVQMIKTLSAMGGGDRHRSQTEQRADVFARGFKARDPEVAVACIEALANMGPYLKPYIPKFVEALRSEDVRVRRAACAILVQYREPNGELIQMAISALEDDDLGAEEGPDRSSVSFRAMIYLYAHKSIAKDAAPHLIKIAKSDRGSDGYRFRALWTAAAVDPEGRYPLETARAWLKKVDDPPTLIRGMQVCAELGPKGKEAVPDLIGLAKLKPFAERDVELHVKLTVVGTLGRIGPAAKDALPALRALESTADPTLRDAIRSATKLIVSNN